MPSPSGVRDEPTEATHVSDSLGAEGLDTRSASTVASEPREERRVDVAIAEQVLGFETRELVGAPDEGGVSHHVAWLMKSDGAQLWEPLPRFSTDERSAQLVLAFVQGHGVRVDKIQTRGWWCVAIEGSEYPKARSLPMAICRAALGFVGGE